MLQAIRAIYEHGQLRLLDAIELVEGEQVTITIVHERESAKTALGDLLVTPSEITEDVNEEALFREIEVGFRGQPSLSEEIIQQRREGP
jgi:predicted DNA-binding antitoxin AbrB/MazE fold protein